MARRRNGLRKTAILLSVALVTGAIGATTAWLAVSRAERAREDKSRLAAFENLTANVIERIAELSVLEYRYTDVMELNRGFFVGGTSSSLVRFSGYVKAGVADVSEVRAAYDPATGSVDVSMPSCELLANEVDIGSVRIWDLKRNLFVPISTEFKIQEVSAFREKVASELEATGFLDDADARASDIVSSLFAGFGSSVRVTLKDKT